jgi:hypothetical protein
MIDNDKHSPRVAIMKRGATTQPDARKCKKKVCNSNSGKSKALALIDELHNMIEAGDTCGKEFEQKQTELYTNPPTCPDWRDVLLKHLSEKERSQFLQETVTNNPLPHSEKQTDKQEEEEEEDEEEEEEELEDEEEEELDDEEEEELDDEEEEELDDKEEQRPPKVDSKKTVIKNKLQHRK